MCNWINTQQNKCNLIVFSLSGWHRIALSYKHKIIVNKFVYVLLAFSLLILLTLLLCCRVFSTDTFVCAAHCFIHFIYRQSSFVLDFFFISITPIQLCAMHTIFFSTMGNELNDLFNAIKGRDASGKNFINLGFNSYSFRLFSRSLFFFLQPH